MYKKVGDEKLRNGMLRGDGKIYFQDGQGVFYNGIIVLAPFKEECKAQVIHHWKWIPNSVIDIKKGQKKLTVFFVFSVSHLNILGSHLLEQMGSDWHPKQKGHLQGVYAVALFMDLVLANSQALLIPVTEQCLSMTRDCPRVCVSLFYLLKFM